MRFTYLLIDLFVLFSPYIVLLILRNILKISQKIFNYKSFIKAFLISGTLFILWDIVFTKIGVWSFNPQHTFGFTILWLPIEEILFFLCIPFASIALFTLVDHLIGKVEIKISNIYLYLSSFIFVLLGLFVSKLYTSVVLILLGIYIFFLASYYPKYLLEKLSTYIFFIISFLPFILVNYILTSIPVVIYNSEYLTNIRILTIPIEDFAYSMLMLLSFLHLYLFFNNNGIQNKKN